MIADQSFFEWSFYTGFTVPVFFFFCLFVFCFFVCFFWGGGSVSKGLNMTGHDQNSSQADIRGKNILQQNQRVNESGLGFKIEAGQIDNGHPMITKAHLEP